MTPPPDTPTMRIVQALAVSAWTRGARPLARTIRLPAGGRAASDVGRIAELVAQSEAADAG